MTDKSLEIQQQILNHPRNTKVVYKPEPHTYHRIYDNGDTEEWQGITSLIKKYAPFPAQKIKYGIVNSRKPKYAHLNTIEEVEADWEASRQQGNIVHDQLEQWGTTGEYTDDPCVVNAVQFFQNNYLYPVAFEHVIWCPVLKRATPADILLVNQYGELVVSDWKTSKNIKRTFYRYNGQEKRMEYPLTHLPNSNYYSYSLQIAFAIRWMREYYNFNFPIASYGYIFHIKGDDFTPYVTLPMQNEVEKIYDWEQRMS